MTFGDKSRFNNSFEHTVLGHNDRPVVSCRCEPHQGSNVLQLGQNAGESRGDISSTCPLPVRIQWGASTKFVDALF